MNKAVMMLEVMGNVGDTPFVMTVTTTGAQTLTLQGMTVANDKTVIVDWGDGNFDTYTAGSGIRTHNYANSGTRTVKMANRKDITLLDLEDSKINLVINSSNPLPLGLISLTLTNPTVTYNANTNPLPLGLTYLRIVNQSGFTYNVNNNPLPSGLTILNLTSLTGLTYNVNTNPLPSGLTSLFLSNLSGLTYNINTNPLPIGLTLLNLTSLTGLTYNANIDLLPSGLASLTLYTLSGLTYDANSNLLPSGLTFLTLNNLAGTIWTTGSMPNNMETLSIISCANARPSTVNWQINTFESIRFESALSSAEVDAILQAIWQNKSNYTYATPSLDLLGTSNAAPNGTYQAASPPTTGKEYKYDLINGAYTSAGPEWTVQTA